MLPIVEITAFPAVLLLLIIIGILISNLLAPVKSNSFFYNFLKERSYQKVLSHYRKFQKLDQEEYYNIIQKELISFIKKNSELKLHEDYLRNYYKQFTKKNLLYTAKDLSILDMEDMIQEQGYTLEDVAYSFSLQQNSQVRTLVFKFNFDMKKQVYSNTKEICARLINTERFAQKIQNAEFWETIES